MVFITLERYGYKTKRAAQKKARHLRNLGYRAIIKKAPKKMNINWIVHKGQGRRR